MNMIKLYQSQYNSGQLKCGASYYLIPELMLQDKGSMAEQQFMVAVTLFCQEIFLTKQSVWPNFILFYPF